jgi:hypothetical protein
MAYDPDYEAFLVRHRREMNELRGRINSAVAASRADVSWKSRTTRAN